MQTISRRHSFQVAAASALLLGAPKMVFAQPIGAILEGIILIGSALHVAELIDKWTRNERCEVTSKDLEGLESECTLMVAFIASEGTGVIPRLEAFLEKQDEHNWRRLKEALWLLLNGGGALVSRVSALTDKLNEKTYPGAHEDLNALKGAYDRIQGAIRAFAKLPDKPEPDTVKAMEPILKEVARLLPLAENAVQQIRIATAERLKQKC